MKSFCEINKEDERAKLFDRVSHSTSVQNIDAKLFAVLHRGHRQKDFQ